MRKATLILAAVLLLVILSGCTPAGGDIRYTIYIEDNGAAGIPVDDLALKRQLDVAFKSDIPADVPDGAAGFQVIAQGGRQGDRTYRLWLSPETGTAYYSGSQGTFEIPRTQAHLLLSLELFSSAWTKPLLKGAYVTLGEERVALPLLDYSLRIEAPMEPYIKEESVEALQERVPEIHDLEGISLELPGVPADVGTEYLNENGEPVDPSGAVGPLTLRITARYDGEKVSGTVRYALGIHYSPPMTAALSTDRLPQGGLMAVRLSHVGEGAQVSVRASHLAEDSPVFELEDGIVALVAAAASTQPGEYEVVVSAARPGGGEERFVLPYTIEKEDFVRQDLTVTGEQQALYTNEAIKRENEAVAAAKAESSPLPLWSGPFILPVQGRISTEYAQERYINGRFSSRHSGIDIAVPQGTPVVATAAGRVAFAGELPISGNTVILDHGLWLFSSYCHLSELSVREGDRVAQGDTVGLVGSTGFSTGPHLHWSVSLRSVYVNPNGLIEVNPLERG